MVEASSPRARASVRATANLRTVSAAALLDAAMIVAGSPPGVGRGFVASFLDERGDVVLDRISERFGLSRAQIAETAGLSQDVIYRARRIAKRGPQARLDEMLEILGRVADWAGGDRQAIAWYRAEPLPSFGGRTAEALVKEGKATAVRDYLDRVATGGFA